MTSITRRTVLSGGAALAGAVISPPFAPAAVGNQKSHSGKTLVHLTVNGHARELELDPRTTVLDALREHLLLTGTKKGCDQGQCDGGYDSSARYRSHLNFLVILTAHCTRTARVRRGDANAWLRWASSARHWPAKRYFSNQ